MLKSSLLLLATGSLGVAGLSIAVGCAAGRSHAPAADPNAAKEADAIIHVSGVT